MIKIVIFELVGEFIELMLQLSKYVPYLQTMSLHYAFLIVYYNNILLYLFNVFIMLICTPSPPPLSPKWLGIPNIPSKLPAESIQDSSDLLYTELYQRFVHISTNQITPFLHCCNKYCKSSDSLLPQGMGNKNKSRNKQNVMGKGSTGTLVLGTVYTGWSQPSWRGSASRVYADSRNSVHSEWIITIILNYYHQESSMAAL